MTDPNGNALLSRKGKFENTNLIYTRLDNFLISLVIWQVLPVSLVEWLVNGGRKYRGQFK